MRNQKTRFVACSLLFLLFSACSTQRNTWLSRHFQELTTRYNVYFNGHEAYRQGIRQLQKSYKEDYSRRLPIYLVSNHEKAKGTASSMDRSIEKCQKAVKKHSIRVKPAKKPNSRSKESKKRFYSKEEFNPFMDRVFLLMAYSQFYKTEFLSTVSTCSYIVRHFSTEKYTCDEANILMARAYTEMDWYYDAENVFNALNKESLTPSLTGRFSEAYADFLIRRKRYGDALPHLEIAIRKSHRRKEKRRLLFLLGQLYQETGKTEQAYRTFCAVPKKNPPYEMALNARIRQTEVYPGNNPEKPLKKLNRLCHSSKNKDFLDQIYYAMGNLYFAAKDTAKAVECYHQSLQKSLEAGPHKLKTLLALGTYYYDAEQYLKAEPCYFEAVSLLKKEDERYGKTFQRSEILKVLAPHLKTIHDEDSLQLIAALPEKERNQRIAALIKEAEKAAKEEKRQKSVEEALKSNEEAFNANGGNASMFKNTMPLADNPANNDKSWYFYNPVTISTGLKEFQRKWGKRVLKDDWRRNTKTDVFESGVPETNNRSETQVDSTRREVTKASGTENDQLAFEGTEDPLSPGYYLKNVPFTEEQKKASDEKIADALYNAAVVFREQMENDRLSLLYFRELERRFPESPLLEKSYYITYLMLKQQKREEEAETDRLKEIRLFPEGVFANRLKNSLFIEKLTEMYHVQDTLYKYAYFNYLQHQTDSVNRTSRYVAENYPACSLIPRFAFLEAMEAARTGRPDDFHRLLTDIVKKYPDSDLVPVIKEMLAYWDQGRRPVPSEGYTNLLSLSSDAEKENQSRADSLERQFQYNPSEPHVLLLRYPATANTNRLQFDVALYNFTHFLIRDYELSFTKVGNDQVLMIRGFENAEDIIRYCSWINFQDKKPEEKYPGIRMVVVSDTNLKLLLEGASIENYLLFFEKHYSDIKPNF